MLVPDSPAVVEALARVVLVPVWQLVRDVATATASPWGLATCSVLGLGLGLASV